MEVITQLANGEHKLGAIWGVSATNMGDLPSIFLVQGGSKGYKVWDWSQPWNKSVGIKFKLGCSIRGSHTCWYRADWSSFYGESNSAIGYSSGTMRKKTEWRWERLVGLWSHSMLTTLGFLDGVAAAMQHSNHEEQSQLWILQWCTSPSGYQCSRNSSYSIRQPQYVVGSSSCHLPMNEVGDSVVHLRSPNTASWLSLIPNLFREFTASIPILVGYYNSQLDPLKRSPYFFVKSPQSGSGWWENPQGRPSGIPMGSHTLLSQLDKLGLYPTYIYIYIDTHVILDIYIYRIHIYFLCITLLTYLFGVITHFWSFLILGFPPWFQT